METYNSDNKINANAPWVINGLFVVYMHLVGMPFLFLYHPSRLMWALTFLIWAISSIGITMGYHRLWSHRSFRATKSLRLALALAGTMGFQGSIKWWCQRHRLHHRYTDTDNDPYNAREGFWFSHIGWIFKRPHYPRIALLDISDLKSDSIVTFQHKYYIPLAIGLGFIFPTLLGKILLGDTFGGFFFIAHVSKLMIWHSTFLINSLAHMIGSQEYSLDYTARGNFLLALLTFGEGHHNFHHQFPKDYRNGVRWFDYDPTKWVIQLCKLFGCAFALEETSWQEIEMAKIVTEEKKLVARKALLNWGPEIKDLPSWTKADVLRLISYHENENEKRKRFLIIIDRLIYDFENFITRHPGGAKLLLQFNGQDASEAFNGFYNSHSTAARTLARTMLVARMADD